MNQSGVRIVHVAQGVQPERQGVYHFLAFLKVFFEQVALYSRAEIYAHGVQLFEVFKPVGFVSTG